MKSIFLPALLVLSLVINSTFANNNGNSNPNTFIMNEDNDELGFILDETSTTPKKSDVRTQSFKPVVRSMAMTLQPRKKEATVIHEKALGFKPEKTHIGNTNKRLHIAPTINLVQTLKTLDHIGTNKMNNTASDKSSKNNKQNNPVYTSKMRAATSAIPEKISNKSANTTSDRKPYKQYVNTTQIKTIPFQHGLNTSILNYNYTRNTTGQAANHNSTSKKDAQPNVIIDSSIKGFLGKDVNFTIDDVGNEAKQKATEAAEKERKARKKAKEMEEAENSEFLKKETQLLNNAFILSNVTNGTSSGADAKKLTVTAHNKSTEFDFRKKQNVNALEHQNKTNNMHDEIHKKYITSPKLHLLDVSDLSAFSLANKTKGARKKDNIDTSIHEECHQNKHCPKNKYCRHYLCYECHRKHHECVEDDQCCDGLPCVYGRCDDKPKGSPGTICDKDSDCGDDGCCVIEPTIDEEHGICKMKLSEFHQCSPVLFRKVWIGDEKPKCGPCKDGLECVEKGVIASHLVCIKRH